MRDQSLEGGVVARLMSLAGAPLRFFAARGNYDSDSAPDIKKWCSLFVAK